MDYLERKYATKLKARLEAVRVRLEMQDLSRNIKHGEVHM